jgi:DNA polymerase (family X)
MTNHEIAERFTRIADILEIEGENPFKVKAYRNAAATIYELDDSLEDIAARSALESLPGFGAAIIAKTKDFLATGTTALWERIKDGVPPGVVTIAGIPGIGPKTAKSLWDALGVTTVEELEAAARAEKVRAVAGSGAAKEAAIIEKIERWRRLTARTPRYLALTIAERLATVLRRLPGISEVHVGGELRRCRDTVDGIDILVAAENRMAAGDAVAALPLLRDVARPDGYTLNALDNAMGIPVRIRFAPNGTVDGYDLLAITGPDAYAFISATDLETRGIAATPERLATEEAIFAALGWPYIPPELRDWPDIVERAQRGAIPQLITVADFRGQLHEHTTYSDGRGTIRDMAEAALARGYEYLAITDHSRSLTIANGLSRDRLLAQLEEIAALKDEYAARGLALLSGIEADILADGSLDCDDDLLERLDVVVGSVHIRYKEDEAAMTARIVRALENPHLDILGHPTGRLLGRREPFPVNMETVIATAARNNKVLEINASPDRMDLSDVYARQAKDAGVLLTINADAHSTSGLDMLPWGLCMARRAGLTPADIINTFPLEKLRATLRR